MTQEDVLQKVNEICSEKSYTSETLTDEFKQKFSDFFSKKYAEDTAVDSEGVLDDIKFNLSTAFSAASRGITAKTNAFSAKVAEYERQIEELRKTAVKDTDTTKPTAISKELQDQLDELKEFKNEQYKRDKRKSILTIAKEGIRKDLHRSFESFAKDCEVSLKTDEKEQANALVARFQEIFKDSIGDIKPYAPKQAAQYEADLIKSVKKIEL